MFARTVSFCLKLNTLQDFKQTFVDEVIPLLLKQPGFHDEIALVGENNGFVTSISLWESEEQAEAYDVGTYSAVLKILSKYLEFSPQVHSSIVIASISHKLTGFATA